MSKVTSPDLEREVALAAVKRYGAILATLIALALIFIWLQHRQSEYVIQSTASTAQLSYERAILTNLRDSYPCEWSGRLKDLNGRPALSFHLDQGNEVQNVRCLRSSLPPGYELKKNGFF